MTKYDENYRASYIYKDGEDIYFDFLIVRTDICEATFVAYGDVYHVMQTSIRHVNADGTLTPWEQTAYAKHIGEVQPLLRVAKEVTAFHNGRMAWHFLDGVVTLPFKAVA